MSLPKWVEDHWESYDHEICGEECPLRKVLSIAWEALENQKKHCETVMPRGSHLMGSYRIAEDAMRRIEELDAKSEPRQGEEAGGGASDNKPYPKR